jgi:hypothetical protein
MTSRPSASCCKWGPYRFTRNPIYLSILHYETLAFAKNLIMRTSFQECERYATAFIGIARRSPGGQAPGG